MSIAFVGGHVTPALAIIDTLPKDVAVFYIGRKYALEKDKAVSLEYTEIMKRNIPFFSLTTGKLSRHLSFHMFFSLAKIPVGFFQALQILSQKKPDCVMSFGSYVSVPVGIAAYVLGIPLIIHEQTTKKGLANNLLTPFARTICLSWESSRQYFPKEKSVLTGNPVISSLQTEKRQKNKKIDTLPLLFITGGSLGSHAINMLISKSLPDLLSQFRVIHQVGSSTQFNDYAVLTKQKETLSAEMQKRYTLIPHLSPEDVVSTIEEATLVISRAGMNTVMLLLAFAKNAIVIPLVVGQHNEQYANARILKNYINVSMLEQHHATKEALLKLVSTHMKKNFTLINDKSYEQELLVHKSSAKTIVSLLLNVSKKETAL